MNQKFFLLITVMLIICCTSSHAQNIGINDNGAAPDTTAMLDISSSTKGFLIPRMTAAQRNLIPSPAQGLLIYSTTDSSFYYYSNGWNRISKSNEGWGLNGNAGIDISTQFLGTTDNKPLLFKTGNYNSGLLNPQSNNTAFGPASLDSVTSGLSNTALGAFAGRNNKTGSNNTFIGTNADALSTGLSNATAVGVNARIDQNHSMALGDAGIKIGVGTSRPITSFCNTDSNIIGTDNKGINAGSITWSVNQQGYAHAIYNRSIAAGADGLSVKIAGTAAANNILDLSTGSTMALAGSSVMVVKANGNVGINKSSPQQKLDVAGSASIRDSVGIGITIPKAQLHLSNLVQNRKLVLWDNTGSDNEFFGFGINPSTLRYQTPGTGSDHVFYAATSASTSNELLRIKGNGKVGISTSNPIGLLSNIDSNILAADGIGLSGNSVVWALNQQGYVLGLYNRFTSNGGNGLSIKLAGTSQNNSILDLSTGASMTGSATTVMTVRANGNVGINTNSPAQKLHVSGKATIRDSLAIGRVNPQEALDVAGKAIIRDSVGIGVTSPKAQLQLGNLVQNRKLVLWDNTGNDNEFYGLGINGGVLRYQTPGASSDHVFYAGSSSGSSEELLRIKGNGNVGIKNSNPVSLLSNTNLNITASDNIGINTNSLSWMMDDVGYTQALYNSSAIPGSNGLSVKIASTNSFSSILDLSTGAVQNGAGTSVFVVKGDGNIGIGTSSPNEKLTINGAVRIDDGGYTGLSNNDAAPVPTGGAGTIAFSNGHFFGWNGTAWKQLDN